MKALASWLRGRRWMVFGAQAVAARAAPRQTLDIDVTVDIGSAELSELLNAAPNHGMSARVASPAEFFTRHFVLPMVHAGGMTVDVVQLGTRFERVALDRASPVELLGVLVPVVTAEDLVVYKLSSDRPRDQEDARSVIRWNADRLDREHVAAELREFERLMDRSDLVSELDRLLSHYRTRG